MGRKKSELSMDLPELREAIQEFAEQQQKFAVDCGLGLRKAVGDWLDKASLIIWRGGCGDAPDQALEASRRVDSICALYSAQRSLRGALAHLEGEVRVVGARSALVDVVHDFDTLVAYFRGVEGVRGGVPELEGVVELAERARVLMGAAAGLTYRFDQGG